MNAPLPASDEPKMMMAPMIDMVFLLLIFFMCASHLSISQSIPLHIPTASKAVVPRDRPDRWLVNLQQDGALFSGSQPIALAELAAQVRARLQEQPGLKLYLRADAETRHGDVKRVMHALTEAGVDDFIFGVHQPGAESLQQTSTREVEAP
jgi:biopolymer transport protein ExbD